MYKENEKLSPEEKAHMREFLRARVHGQSPLNHGTILGSTSNIFRLFRMVAAGFASIVVVTGSIAYAAEYALPGDILYAVKVEINERARSMTAVTSKQQAAWSVTRMVRRLDELEQLVATGTFDEKTREKVAMQIEHDTNEVNAVIAQLKTESIDVAMDTSSRLEESLRVHERALTQVAEDREDISAQVHVILDTVRKKTQSISEIRQEIEKERNEARSAGVKGSEVELATSTAIKTKKDQKNSATSSLLVP